MHSKDHAFKEHPLPDYRTAAEKRAHAQRAAHIRWAKERDFSAATAPGRRAFEARFDKQARVIMQQLNPDVVPDESEVATRAASLRSAYFAAFAARGRKAQQRLRR